MKKGIFLVANYKSQNLCSNLIYSIRQSGCKLPIRVIHFGGKKINSKYILQEAEYLSRLDFSKEANQFIDQLSDVLTACPRGYLYRFLGWFSDWDEFIYSDNDIVALMNWEELFTYLPGYDIVHADEEYTTEGRFNYEKPEFVKKEFGNDALLSAITAGHYVARRQVSMTNDMLLALKWFTEHPDIPKFHDQAMLHIASLLGGWKVLNLCKSPYYWLSSWSGDYRNILELVLKMQIDEKKRLISHIHYSGGTPNFNSSIEELLYSNLSHKNRLYKSLKMKIMTVMGYFYLKKFFFKITKKVPFNLRIK